MKEWKSARNALQCVFEALPGERALIVCDDEREPIGRAFSQGALALGLWTKLVTLETSNVSRTEIPEQLLEILSSKPDIYINLLRGIREETPFRIRLIQLETRDRRARLGHCPGVTLDMLQKGALALTVEQHKHMQGFARRLMNDLKRTTQVEVTAPSGTTLTFSTKDRPFFTDTFIDWKLIKWMNLPTGEVIVAPIEDSLDGKLVSDLAIGGIGPLKNPVEFTVENGVATKVNTQDKDVLKRIKQTFKTDAWANVVGEFAFGINPQARLIKEFLEAEKILGTIHIAFGHNTDMPGGMNSSANHMDVLLSKPTVKATKKTGETIEILQDGKFSQPHAG